MQSDRDLHQSHNSKIRSQETSDKLLTLQSYCMDAQTDVYLNIRIRDNDLRHGADIKTTRSMDILTCTRELSWLLCYIRMFAN